MANSLLNNGRNLFYQTFYRRLSSFNNNRTKPGIFSILNNEDLNIWSENNWTEFAKQFNKSTEFPFPGQIGIVVVEPKGKKQPLRVTSENKILDKTKEENLNFLFNKSLNFENQAIKLREATTGFIFKSKLENNLFNGSTMKQSFELKAHKCPTSLFKDFQNFFQLNSINESDLTIITISFKTENDMATWNNAVDSEREVLMKKFVDTAQELCNIIEKEGCWADYIDPSSGRPNKSSYGHAAFYETDERYRKLGFEIVDYGCCKVISHHEWGTKTYVGCMLTTAPSESKIVKTMVERFN